MAIAADAGVNYDDLLGEGGGSWRSKLIWLALLGTLTAAIVTGVWWEFLRGSSAAAATVQTATVSVGNVTKTVSTSGTVAAKSSTNLNFTTTGTGSSRIAKVDVTLGQQVKQGDVLMELDPTTAQSALDSAKLSLSIQQSKLNALLQGNTASTLASADQSVQQSQANYDQAVRALQDLQKPADATTLETAQQAVTTAQAQLQQAKDARVKLDTDRTAGITTAQAAVTNAQNTLTSAQLSQSNAASAITTAQASLNSAEMAYSSLVPLPTPAVSFSAASLAAPVSSGDQATLLGVSSSGTPEQAKAASAVLTANGSYMKSVSDKQTADNSVASAQNALSVVSTALSTARAGPTAGQVAVANAAIGSAQAQADAAQAKLVTLQAGPTPEAVQTAQSAIDTAAASLAAAKAKQTEAYAGPLATDVQQQQANVSQAQTAAGTAQQNLNSTKLIAPFDGTVAALNNQAGDLAGSGTSSTTAAVVLNTPDQVVLNMSIGETDYNTVKVGQTGTAVFAGIPGRTFSIVIDSIGSSPTTTQGVVSYAAQAHFTAGGPAGSGAGASGTPGARGRGGAASGTPTTAQASGTATTPQASPTAASGTTPTADATPFTIQKPAPGMNATITIVTAQSQGVLLVPNAAVTRSGQDRVLQVKQSDGSTQSVTVQVGLSDTKNTEITSGASEGATVVLPGVVATSSTTAGTAAASGTGANSGGFGGGNGGGRGAGAPGAGGN